MLSINGDCGNYYESHGTTMCRMIRNGQPGNHTFQRFSLFGHIVRMPEETDASKILTTSLLENWRRPLKRLVLRGWRVSSRIWNPIISPWMKQLMWLRIIHSGDWYLRLALYALLVVHAKKN